MKTRRALATTVSLLAAACLVATVPGPAVSEIATIGQEATGNSTNPWIERRVLNMAHSGGEVEAPTNTMYAFKRAVNAGADMIELDVQSTKDRRLVVLHNATVDATTNGEGAVAQMTLAQVRKLDAAYWFVPGEGTVRGKSASAYKLRGARNGAVKVPGYRAGSFAIPTLNQVFGRFPKVPINIEIKGTSDEDTGSFIRTGKLLAEFLNERSRTDLIVTSFNDRALARFHDLAPQVGLAPGKQGLTDYFLRGVPPIEGTVALQVPITFSGFPVVSRRFSERAHADGYAVHAWFSGSAEDDRATYNQVLDACVDGLMPARPTLLESILDERGIVRPGLPGIDPCAAPAR